jgi:hypothetical protein
VEAPTTKRNKMTQASLDSFIKFVKETNLSSRDYRTVYLVLSKWGGDAYVVAYTRNLL